MISKSRQINLLSKTNSDVFKIINKDIFGVVEPLLGSIQGAVNRMIAPNFSQLLKCTMPSLISLNPDDPAWFKRVKNYWDSWGIRVPIGGKTFEIGFNFDLNDSTVIEKDYTRLMAIKSLIKEAADKKFTIDSDETFAEYVLKNVPEFQKYKYASPINVTDYLTWIFLLGHRMVAKETEAINKSTNIEFVLIDPKELEDARRTQHTISNEALKKYIEILTDRSLVKDILFVKGTDASRLDDLDCDAALRRIAESNPKEFLAILNNKATSIKARIEKYCMAGILRRLDNTNIIVDANDNSTVVGNTIDEAVVFFSSETPDRVAKVKEFKTRYSQINKN